MKVSDLIEVLEIEKIKIEDSIECYKYSFVRTESVFYEEKYILFLGNKEHKDIKLWNIYADREVVRISKENEEIIVRV